MRSNWTGPTETTRQHMLPNAWLVFNLSFFASRAHAAVRGWRGQAQGKAHADEGGDARVGFVPSTMTELTMNIQKHLDEAGRTVLAATLTSN